MGHHLGTFHQLEQIRAQSRLLQHSHQLHCTSAQMTHLVSLLPYMFSIFLFYVKLYMASGEPVGGECLLT